MGHPLVAVELREQHQPVFRLGGQVPVVPGAGFPELQCLRADPAVVSGDGQGQARVLPQNTGAADQVPGVASSTTMIVTIRGVPGGLTARSCPCARGRRGPGRMLTMTCRAHGIRARHHCAELPEPKRTSGRLSQG